MDKTLEGKVAMVTGRGARDRRAIAAAPGGGRGADIVACDLQEDWLARDRAARSKRPDVAA